MAEDLLHELIAARALAYVSAPPTGRVVELVSPDELTAIFDTTVGLDIGEGVAHTPDALLAGVDQVLRYSVATNHPRFMNQNFAGADPIAVVGDWLGAALNTTAATYEVAPVFTLMERAVLGRLAATIGYEPPADGDASGLFCAGGSLAGLMALQLARHRADPDIVRRGTGGQRFAVFVSNGAHYSVEKNAAVLGIGTDSVVSVATDATGAMDVVALIAAISAERERGVLPLAVIATAGTTVTAAFDPLSDIADICEREQLWMHVDACYGGSALFSESQRLRLRGVHRSDSVMWNLHKMMGMTQQCTALLVRRSNELRECFASGADYLFQPDKLHGGFDAGDNTIMCGRRVDVLKLWLAWKFHGDAGFAARVDRAVELADHGREQIESGGLGLRSVSAGDFTNVCFLWAPPELHSTDLGELDPTTRQRLHEVAPAVKERMQREGNMMLGYQPVEGINAFRLIVMNPQVQASDIDQILETVARHSAELW